MELINILNKEFLRPLITLIIPGWVAIMPWFFFFYHHVGLKDVWNSEKPSIIFLLLILSLGVGLILEDIGSRQERRYRDQVAGSIPHLSHNRQNLVGCNYLHIISCDVKEVRFVVGFFQNTQQSFSVPAQSDFDDKWKQYLRMERSDDKKEKVGLAYISSLVTRMKFELSIGISLILSGISFSCFFGNGSLTLKACWLQGLTVGLIFAAGIYLLCEAYDSVKLLHETRVALNS